MPRSVRTVSVNLNAGLSKFMGDLDKGAAKLREFGGRGVGSVQGISGALRELEASNQRTHSSFERIGGDAERVSRNVGRLASRTTSAGLEMAGAFRLGQLALRAQGQEASVAEKAYVGLRNAIRATEVTATGVRAGVGAAIDVAGAIGVVAAIEAIAEHAYTVGKRLEQQSVQAAKSDLSYDQVATLGFASSRAGVSPDFFDRAAKAAGGADLLGQKLKALGEIADPVERARAAWNAFGADAERLLPFLNDRFSENTKRVAEWGLTLSKVDRENIDTFKRDIDSLKQSFVGLSDEIAAWSTSTGNYFSRAFGSIYSTARDVPGLAATIMGIVTGGIGRATGAPEIAFSEEPFDVAIAAARARKAGLDPNNIGVVQASQPLGAAGSKLYLAGRGDQKEQLQARVGELEKQLFVSDRTSSQFGKLQPAAAFPGGYSAQALALQEYISAQNRLAALKKPEKEDADPYGAAMHKLRAELEGVNVELEMVGKSHAAQVLAKAFTAADVELARVNEHLKTLGLPQIALGSPQGKAMQSRMADVAIGKDQLEWGQKIDAVTKKLRDETDVQDRLTAAIGRGYDALKQAHVEAAVMTEMGPEKYNDSAYDTDAARVRAGAAEKFDADHRERTAQTIQGLREQIELEKALAAVVGQGADAVRAVTASVRERQELARGVDRAEIQAEKDAIEAERTHVMAESIAEINERTAATERLIAAIGKGAAATRQANLENRIAEIRRSGDAPAPGIAGVGQREIAERGNDAAIHQQQVTAEALKTGLEYQNQFQAITEQIAALEKIKLTQGDNLAIEISLRDLENQRLKVLVDQSLQLRTARAGIRAFFIEMQEDAESAGRIIYDSLNSALDRISSNLAKLFTGQKTDWAKSFQQLGEQMMQSSIKSLAQQGLGKLGKVFGVDLGGAKPDGTSANPIWVRLAGASGGPAIPGGGIPGLPGGIPGVGRGGGGFGGGDQGGGVFSALGKMMGIGSPGAWNPAAAGLDMDVATASGDTGESPGMTRPGGARSGAAGFAQGSDLSSGFELAAPVAGQLAGTALAKYLQGLAAARAAAAGASGAGAAGAGIGADADFAAFDDFGGFMADGGSVEPGKVYGVGEEGMEYFAPATEGRIIPQGALGGNTYSYSIDARGADLGAQNRIARGIDASHRAAVMTAVRANHERSLRTPGK